MSDHPAVWRLRDPGAPKPPWDTEIEWDGPQFEIPIPLPGTVRKALTLAWRPRPDGFVRVFAYGPPGEANCVDYAQPGIPPVGLGASRLCGAAPGARGVVRLLGRQPERGQHE